MNVIIDYKVGNIRSVQLGFQRINMETIISSDINVIKQADLLILPGVGAFKDAMKELENRDLIEVIQEHVSNNKILIGICLGMQLLFEDSEEFGYTKGLGLIQGNIKELNIPYKVPHMGWNSLDIKTNDDTVKNIKKNDFVYFVHSYYAVTDQKYVIASTDYGVEIPAIVRKDNVIGMQFHPEKSGLVGLQLLQNIKELIV